jgi:hypothetical protein
MVIMPASANRLKNKKSSRPVSEPIPEPTFIADLAPRHAATEQDLTVRDATSMCGCHQGRAQSPRESGAKSVDAEREKGEVAEEKRCQIETLSPLSIYI